MDFFHCYSLNVEDLFFALWKLETPRKTLNHFTLYKNLLFTLYYLHKNIHLLSATDINPDVEHQVPVRIVLCEAVVCSLQIEILASGIMSPRRENKLSSSSLTKHLALP